MANAKLSAETLKHCNALLPHELSAVQQHFIHVLILRAWKADELARGIIAVDEVDLPNAMKIVDLLVASGNLPDLGQCLQSQMLQMPMPGDSFKEIFDAERRIEARLTDVLSDAKRGFRQQKIRDETRKLITKPWSARKTFAAWMQNREQAGFPDEAPQASLAKSKLRILNTYFAHLALTINQEMIHSFVHWHSGEKQLADAAWATSGGAMMQATAITNLLAKRRLSPAPIEGLSDGELLSQHIASGTEAALSAAAEQALSCRFAAEKARQAMVGTEFEFACRRGAEYFKKLSAWQPGTALPKITNPCIDFERVLRLYVWQDRDPSRLPA